MSTVIDMRNKSADQRITFETNVLSVLVNDVDALGGEGRYYAEVGDTASISAEVVNSEGERQTHIDAVSLGYPPVLKTPVIKTAGGNVVDEVLFTTTIVEGVITFTGKVHVSGTWTSDSDRLNEALKGIGADWKISPKSISFLV